MEHLENLHRKNFGLLLLGTSTVNASKLLCTRDKKEKLLGRQWTSGGLVESQIKQPWLFSEQLEQKGENRNSRALGPASVAAEKMAGKPSDPGQPTACNVFGTISIEGSGEAHFGNITQSLTNRGCSSDNIYVANEFKHTTIKSELLIIHQGDIGVSMVGNNFGHIDIKSIKVAPLFGNVDTMETKKTWVEEVQERYK
ncbi:hypothetical protein BJ875DRAFT_446720 [Amylocarpus encephaloides]|uniref:Uncharacterized protein n=1 Tax=Amylocarpus encephaloides TaxID=45428 RepID=A0A9P7Y8W7_9HELO|nr:hypothetical protein BJ875DRAFT_446720 [Amylocarpus encephaloides]